MSKDAELLANTVALELAQLRELIAGPLSQWSNGLKVDGARPLQLSRAAVQPNLHNGNGRLLGWSLLVPADGDGPGTVVLRDGDGGDIVGQETVPAGASATRHLGAGVSVGQALYAEVSGPVVGVVYFRD